MKLLMYPFVQCMICASGFASWSIMQKMFGLTVGWAMGILTIVQFGATFWLFRLAPEIAPVRGTILFALCGAIPNGIAIVSLGYLLRQKGEVITTWIPVMNAMILIVSLLGGAILLGEALTLRKMVGVGAICFGIYVMSSR